MFGGISGGHFNPAVSLGVYIGYGKEYGENFIFLMLIIISQLLGMLVGVGIVWATLNVQKGEGTRSGNFAVLCP